MIDYSPSIAAACERLRVLPYSAGFAALPEAIRAAVLAAVGKVSPVDAVVDGFEALWAARGQLDADTRAVCADLAFQVVAGGFHSDHKKPGRADAVIRHLRADAGEIPAEGLPDAPAVDERFVPPAPKPEPAPEPQAAPDPAPEPEAEPEADPAA